MLSRIGRYSLAALAAATVLVPGSGRTVARANHFFFHHHGQTVVTGQQSSMITTGSTLVAPQAAFFTSQVLVPQATTTHLLVPQVGAGQLTVPQVAPTHLVAPQFTGFVTAAPLGQVNALSPSLAAFTGSSTQVSPSASPAVFAMNPDGVSFPTLSNLLRGDPLGLHNLRQVVTGAIAARKGDLASDGPGRGAAITAIEDIALQALAGSVPGAGLLLGNADVRGEVEQFVNQLVLKIVGKGGSRPPGTSTPEPVKGTSAPDPVKSSPIPVGTPAGNRVDIYIHILNETGSKPAEKPSATGLTIPQ